MTNKTVLITGCSSGFGLATSNYLKNKGFRVISTVRSQLDLTWPESRINQVIAKIIKEFKQVDVLVNNAGYGHLGQIADFSETSLRQQFETNLFGTHKITKALLPHFREKKSGLIINVSSILGLFSIPNYGIYSASKFALEGYSQALRLEESKNNIKVVVVNPGAFKTKFNAKSHQQSDTNQKRFDYGSDPMVFAKLIDKIINSSNPKQNYIIGREAIFIKLFLSLPTSFRSSLINKFL